MDWLIILAVALLVLWVVGKVFGFVVGAAFNLLWIGAIVLFVIWIVQSVAGAV